MDRSSVLSVPIMLARSRSTTSSILTLIKKTVVRTERIHKFEKCKSLLNVHLHSIIARANRRLQQIFFVVTRINHSFRE